ncbi:MAG: 23S rRNA (pseudouridine(1915)-N(3))-methyltransferase RlmH [Xanthobacteraceae bacterium]|nr:23S rRNA (pseudouridine(1915)-N(3))-methyltransferase RlmH [Xanthobacteraceae bacterium]
MRVVVIAVGRLKQGPERELAERYRARFEDIGRRLGFRGLEIHELPEGRQSDVTGRMAEEASAIEAAIPEKSVIIALDERGENLESTVFADRLALWRDDAVPCAAFIIGGADGLAPEFRRKAKLRLSFGKATWPHQIVRILVLEQLYRAGTILSGHPYHRA